MEKRSNMGIELGNRGNRVALLCGLELGNRSKPHNSRKNIDRLFVCRNIGLMKKFSR